MRIQISPFSLPFVFELAKCIFYGFRCVTAGKYHGASCKALAEAEKLLLLSWTIGKITGGEGRKSSAYPKCTS